MRQNLVADGEFGRGGLDDLTGEVDTGHQGVLPHHAAAGCQGECVFVVDAGISDPDGDIAGLKFSRVECLDRGGDRVAVFACYQRSE